MDRRRHELRDPRACRWCRSSPSTRCSASSGWATSSGRPPTPAPGASSSAPPPGAPRCSARASSTRTATACCWRRPCRCARPTTPPSPTRWRRSSGTASSACTPRRARRGRGRLLLPHPLQRELRDAGQAGGRRPTTTSSPASTAGPTAPRASTPTGRRSCSPARPRARPAPPPPSWPRRHGVGVELWSATSYKRLREDALAAERWNRLHPDAEARGRRSSPPRSADGDGPDRRRHRLHAGRARPDQPVGADARTPASAPTASAAPTRARRCAGSSRPTRPTSSSPCSPRWPPTGTIDPAVVLKAAADHGIDRDVAPSWTR